MFYFNDKPSSCSSRESTQKRRGRNIDNKEPYLAIIAPESLLVIASLQWQYLSVFNYWTLKKSITVEKISEKLPGVSGLNNQQNLVTVGSSRNERLIIVSMAYLYILRQALSKCKIRQKKPHVILVLNTFQSKSWSTESLQMLVLWKFWLLGKKESQAFNKEILLAFRISKFWL